MLLVVVAFLPSSPAAALNLEPGRVMLVRDDLPVTPRWAAPALDASGYRGPLRPHPAPLPVESCPGSLCLDRPGCRRDRFRIELCEALPPTGVAQRPAEFALGLGVRGTARLGSHRHEGVAGEQP